jgi:hypothetical protein
LSFVIKKIKINMASLLKDGKEEGEDTSDSDVEESRPEVPIPKVIIASSCIKVIIYLK